MVQPPNEPVLWIPSHAAQGSISMQRYWAALKEAAEGLGRPVRSALREPAIPVKASGRLRRAIKNYWAYPRHCRRMLAGGEFKVAHILDHSYTHLLKVVPPSCKTLVTVHDLIPFREPAEMTASQMERFRKKMGLLKGADRLVAVSESTRGDIVEFLGIPSERVAVIPNGVTPKSDFGGGDADSYEPLFAPSNNREKSFTVLSIGLAVTRKNLGILPDVFRSYLNCEAERPRLIRVGDPLPEELGTELGNVLGSDYFIECGRVSDGELAYLYQHVDALIFPSSYEGFGLPILEAMAAGCPVVASAIPCHLEVGGDCASYFAPDDAKSAGMALAEVAAGGGGTEQRISNARERAAQFTWERHVEKLFEIYDEITG